MAEFGSGKLFNISKVIVECMKSPQLPKRWAVQDFQDQKLCNRVLKAFRKAGMGPADFEEAVHSAREQMYKASRNNFVKAIGIPYGQWMAMEIACRLLDIKGFSFGAVRPFFVEAPADHAYTTMWLKKVENYKFTDLPLQLEGLSLDRWCLYEDDTNPSASASASASAPAVAKAENKQSIAKAANKRPAAAAAAAAGEQPALKVKKTKQSATADTTNAATSKQPVSATTSAPAVAKAANKQPTTAPAAGEQPALKVKKTKQHGYSAAANAAAGPAFVQRAPAAKSLGKGGLADSQWALGESLSSPSPEVPGGLVKGGHRFQGKGKGKGKIE